MEFMGSDSASRHVLEWLAGRGAGLARWLARNRFGLVAFLIPVGIRAIPEIIVGPYPVGWDTIAFYVPNTLDWASGKAGPLQMLGTAPLMYMISVPAYLLLRTNPVWIFKVMGPILYGGMIWALFRFLKLGSRWLERHALGAALLTSLYFVTLRISWDLYRSMLGLTFILLILPLLGDHEGPRKQVLLSALTVLAVASDQPVSLIGLTIFGARALQALAKGARSEFLRLTWIALPGIALFMSIVYAGLVLSIGIPILDQTVPDAGLLASSVAFLSYAYLPILPLAAFGFSRTVNVDLRNWSIFCLLAALAGLLPSFGLVMASYRWTMLLDVPICVYAAMGLTKLKGCTDAALKLIGHLERKIMFLFCASLVLLAVFYLALPAQQAMVYYTPFTAILPSSMVQDTVPMSDMGSLVDALHWVALNSGPKTALITHQAMYGWARAYIPSTSDRIVNYGYSTPLEGVGMARSSGYSSVLLVWWVKGLGWHGQPDVPRGFVPIIQYENLVVYSYL